MYWIRPSRFNDVFLNASNDRCISLAQETDKDEVLVRIKKSNH